MVICFLIQFICTTHFYGAFNLQLHNDIMILSHHFCEIKGWVLKVCLQAEVNFVLLLFRSRLLIYAGMLCGALLRSVGNNLFH